jgi:hypothetical protein
LLTGFGIRGFRSFGPERQLIAPLRKINVFAGQNNVGKSNLLNVVNLIRLSKEKPGKLGLDSAIDDHHGRESRFELSLPLPTDLTSQTELSEQVASRVAEPNARAQTVSHLNRLLEALALSTEGAWFSYDAAGNLASPTTLTLGYERGEPVLKSIDARTWYVAWTHLNNQQSGSLTKHHVPQVLMHLSPLHWTDIAKVHKIEAFRRIGAPGTVYEGLNGQGLIGKLLELQNPEFTKREDSKKFAAINQFIRDITTDPHAELKIPSTGRELQVLLNGKLFPIDSLGTGLHELVIFAVAASIIEGEILCIEEPEIHLHPRLQRKLLEFLSEKTSNQYFLTSHSAHLLDFPGAAVFHLRLNEYGETLVQHVADTDSHVQLCFDLGYRPSDILQSNCVIWVEGPSDRAYLRAWIAAIDSELQEGSHFSIMFYGGRLLSHLGADDPDVNDFISLKRLNRRMVIVMDSDRAGAGEEINATKQRIQLEFSRNSGLAWVTAGREIENYIGREQMISALSELYPDEKFKHSKSIFEKAYQTSTQDRIKRIDKVKLAKYLHESTVAPVLDLQERVTELVQYIKESNN